MDWDDLRIFLQVARSGQMSAAARLLDIDHSTISRRISRLEQHVGVTLFDRAGRRISITEGGTRLLAAAEEVERTVIRDVATLADGSRQISGCVRIGVSEGFGAFYLARRLPLLARRHPDLDLELVVLPRTFSLASREVDLAIGMERPERGSLRIKKLTSFDIGIFASSGYIRRNGQPGNSDELTDHAWCGYIKERLFTPELDFTVFEGVELHQRFRTTSIMAQLEAVLGGEVLGILPSYMARPHPELVRILPSTVCFSRNYWLAVHDDLAELARIRCVMQEIEHIVRADRAVFSAA